MMKGSQKSKRVTALRKKLFMVGGLAAAGLLIVMCVVYFVFRSRLNAAGKNTIYDHIFIESVDVSGMNKAKAKQALEDKAAEYRGQAIALCVGEENIEVSLGELGFEIKDLDKAVDEAVAYAKDGSVWSRYRKIRKLEKDKKEIPVVYGIDAQATTTVLTERAQALEKTAADAAITRENGAFQITDEVQGKKIDIEASVKAIEQYFNQDWNKKEAATELVVATDDPKVKRQDLETIQDVLGTFTTYCGTGGGRVKNIESGTAHINGAVVMPGEEYSANAAMEPYTYDNGFTEAGSYENGQVVQSMGGGICQVSSTLYNAVILAELEVTQRQPHSMMVNYVKPSMDAAIAGTYKDLKFKNSTNTPIYIEGYVSGGNVTFTIYGKETRAEGREIEYISETLSSEPAGEKFEASGAELGTMQKGGSPHTGTKARLWKVVRENGAEVSRDVINNSNYMASPHIISVGTASDNAEASALVQNAIGSQDRSQIEAAIAQAKQMIADADNVAAGDDGTVE